MRQRVLSQWINQIKPIQGYLPLESWIVDCIQAWFGHHETGILLQGPICLCVAGPLERGIDSAWIHAIKSNCDAWKDEKARRFWKIHWNTYHVSYIKILIKLSHKLTQYLLIIVFKSMIWEPFCVISFPSLHSQEVDWVEILGRLWFHEDPQRRNRKTHLRTHPMPIILLPVIVIFHLLFRIIIFWLSCARDWSN